MKILSPLTSIALRKINIFPLLFLSLFMTDAANAGIQPLSMAVIIPHGKDNASIDIKNTGSSPVLLYSKIVKLPDDNLSGGVLYPSPDVIVIGAGQTQSVRVIYKNNKPLTKEHYARIVFTGLPPESSSSDSTLNFLVGQDLPVVINYSKNINQNDIWQLIHYNYKGSNVCISNPTNKVFRFDPTFLLINPKMTASFSKPYLLPGEHLCFDTGKKLSSATKLSIDSVSDYSFELATHSVSLHKN